MRISALDGQRVALWGWGREGKAAYRALRGGIAAQGTADSSLQADASRAATPQTHAFADALLTLFCSEQEVDDARALGDAALRIETDATAERLAAFAVVIKSPGISAYRPELLAAAASGTRFTGGTTLWFGARPDARTVCVTGTKGKSTTSALTAHLLRKGGHRTALAGNIGMPLLELLDGQADVWVIELSSYQTRDVAASGVPPDVAVVTNVYPEHLDWHGSEQRYVADKLALVTKARPRIAVLNASDPTLENLAGAHPGATGSIRESDRAWVRACTGEVRWYGSGDGWHLRDDALYRGAIFVMDTAAVPLPGRHNRSNLCAALTAIDALGIDAAALAPHALSFQPLPHRLQTLGTRDGVTWVNDSISTTPHATLAALDVFRGRAVALLVGGHDRGLEWGVFAEAMCESSPQAIVTMGQNGERIHALLEPLAAAGTFTLRSASDLEDAVALAREALDGDGVMLMSPGAPSYGVYRDFTERGRHFARLAGFDPDAITAIPGIGIL